jgi:hypothetical protein
MLRRRTSLISLMRWFRRCRLPLSLSGETLVVVVGSRSEASAFPYGFISDLETPPEHGALRSALTKRQG